MGMAAGQARLLSITSRMSDNELRAQLINNDKMRLATKSAQVSEAYTNALNNAQLMFTNYDKENNTSYKELTFNSLTAYNQYNNQYAISNSAGQLLVSETDAKNFEKSADLKSFLNCYGLEETTTYFDNLSKYSEVGYYTTNNLGEAIKVDKSAGIVYNTGLVADDHNIQKDSGYKPDILKDMYEGKNGYDSYNTIKSSEYYYNYQSALSNFSTAETTFKTKAAEIMNTLLGNVKTASGATIYDIKKNLAGAADTNAAKAEIDKLLEIIGSDNSKGLRELSTADSKNYYDSMVDILNKAKNDQQDISSSNLKVNETDGSTIDCAGAFQLRKDASGNWKAYFYTSEEEGKDATLDENNAFNVTVSNGTLSFNNGKTAGDSERIAYSGIPIPVLQEDGKYAIPSSTFTETSLLDLEDYQRIGQTVITSLINSISNTFDIKRDEYKKQNGTDIPEYTAYKEAAAKLYETIFGNAMPSTFDENKWSQLTDINAIPTLGKFKEPEKDKDDKVIVDKAAEFEKIKQAEVLDAIMNTYGEPNYDWIDTSNKNASYNENGSAKAQWYTNLYNKMEKSGYKALQDGLASSAEWIQFAFESGLVCLEQVDANNNWNTTTYTNCSDITEQTNNAALTKAEAEYNAAMAKIENKDKRYDLELKNIDTEHNSLQTEYDSIKTAIDKNIERTFKIYS